MPLKIKTNKTIIQVPYWNNDPATKPLPAQLSAHRANYRFRMLSGAVRAGKSVWGCQEGLKLSFKFPGNTGAIVRSTLTELKRTTQVTFFKMFGTDSDDAAHPLIKKWNKSEQHLRFINGSDLYFIGVENWSVLKSLDLGWVFVDEGIDISSDALKFLRTRLSKVMTCPGYNQYFLTATNPGDENHILFKWFLKPPEDDDEAGERKKFWSIFTTSYDNIHLTPDFKREIDSWKSDKEFYERYALGRWGRFKGLVYGEYNEAMHMVKREQYDEYFVRIKEFYCGTDWGYTNPAAIVFLGLTNDNEIIQFDEIYVTEKTNPELRALFFEKCNLWKIQIRRNECDPSEPSDIKEFSTNGIPSVAADNDIEAGLRKVKEFLRIRGNGRPGYYVFEHCYGTRKEFGLYRRPTEEEVRKNKNLPELPIDKDNHALGALRYFIYSHFRTQNKLQAAFKGAPGTSGPDRPLDLIRARKREYFKNAQKP